VSSQPKKEKKNKIAELASPPIHMYTVKKGSWKEFQVAKIYRESTHTIDGQRDKSGSTEEKRASVPFSKAFSRQILYVGCYSSSSSAKTFFFFSIFSFRLLNGSQTSSIFIRCHLRFPPLQLSCCCSVVVFRCCERRARGSGY
jgi:hypothetical protein